MGADVSESVGDATNARTESEQGTRPGQQAKQQDPVSDPGGRGKVVAFQS